MRKLTFTNANGLVTVFGEKTLVIELLSGLSTPELQYQDQRAPYQDGVTHIDTLFEAREIVCEGSINKPKDILAINAIKDTLIKNLNPKLGEGWLLYESNGVSRKIKATCHIIFGNKHAMEPYQKYQATFRCADPYWQDLTADTISLPTSTNGAEATINSAGSYSQSIVQLSNGNIFAVYCRLSDNFLVSREYNGAVWSTESVINSFITQHTSVIQKSNGNIVVAYCGLISGFEYYAAIKEYNGSSWGAENKANSTNSASTSVLQIANGNIYISYVNYSTNKLVSREYNGTTWSPESTINNSTAYECSLSQKTNGNILSIYRDASVSNIVLREFNGISWSDEYLIATNSTSPTVAEDEIGNIFAYYSKVSNNNIVFKMYDGNSWSSEYTIAENKYTPSVSSLSNNRLIISYINATSHYLLYIIRGVTPVNAEVTGHAGTPVEIRLNGPSTNPRIVHSGKKEEIRINATLSAADYFIIRTGFGEKSIEFWQGGIKKNGLSYLQIGSKFFGLGPGDNEVYYNDDSVASTATATMTWTERYIGC